ncbi:hypothetical protein CROQUDRAFT_666646 [Cronartium quercuum f. sp. fusiforme G11]|uniref:Uncharacterized protein n=1 Tax=Cronartium quercuum f. sp. fusiforme G11 TaxID=708437 RepID=A0A9P6N5Q3_9BASI|nr:hypothetical protein CROQUDRAFT_666646 [Cronartium quercuum f. sp. fusiforme G11]
MSERRCSKWNECFEKCYFNRTIYFTPLLTWSPSSILGQSTRIILLFVLFQLLVEHICEKNTHRELSPLQTTHQILRHANAHHSKKRQLK